MFFVFFAQKYLVVAKITLTQSYVPRFAQFLILKLTVCRVQNGVEILLSHKPLKSCHLAELNPSFSVLLIWIELEKMSPFLLTGQARDTASW